MDENEKIEVKDDNGNTITIDADKYPSNSNRSKTISSSTKVRKVAHGKTVKKRKSIREIISDWLFVNEEDYEWAP